MRKVLAAGLSVLTIALAVAAPAVVGGTLADHPVAESQHAPGECATGHDHLICAKMGEDVASAEGVVHSPRTAATETTAFHGDLDGPRVSRADEATRSRAPPLL